jgi:hypothetical protein
VSLHPAIGFAKRPRAVGGVRVLVVSWPCGEGGASVSWASPRPVPGSSGASRYADERRFLI